MKPYISADLQKFLTPGPNEEAVDQPLYSAKSYAAAGQTVLSFFGDTQSSTDVYTTNMDGANMLGVGKRFVVFGVGVALLNGGNPVQSNVSSSPVFNLADAQAVLEGKAEFEFKIIDKVYLQETPLSRLPAGIGLAVGAGGIQQTQATAAAGTNAVTYASNGVPQLTAMRRLRVPMALPSQVRFSATINFASAISIGSASRMIVILDGMMIRARQ